MGLKSEYFIFILALGVKFLLSMIISVDMVLIVSVVSIIFLYGYMFYKRKKVYAYMPFLMIDYLLQFYCVYLRYGMCIKSIYMSFIIFVITSGFLYWVILMYASDFKKGKKVSNWKIDKGIKALERREYQLAEEYFLSAIREHKENYLGYLGMCNVIKSENKYCHSKKFEYYKKKCIKYAPRQLKPSLVERYK